MNLIMGIRIKASEDFNDLLALSIVGGRVADGKYPKFSFHSDIQRNKYEEVRKKLKGGESLENIGNTST
ncbi:hypothetical protein J2T13_000828 [Paenibacillus sp. DS2015]|uniref:hypothetical protein n=1 Tax=Paenibacillus sp. DS2015 TaxID=3373917 RepID=UPI003D1C07AD